MVSRVVDIALKTSVQTSKGGDTSPATPLDVIRGQDGRGREGDARQRGRVIQHIVICHVI